MNRAWIAAAFGIAATPAIANDSIAELGTGGIILSRTESISMASEDLYISPEKVTVDYVFKNEGDKDIETVVAFPMPVISADQDAMTAIPEETSDNFLGFEVTIESKPVKPELEQKAYAAGLDVTADLIAQHVSLNPYADNVAETIAKLPDVVAQDWIARGILIGDYSDEGRNVPHWDLKSTYWWRQTFPANSDLHVSHRYKPSVGGTSSVGFFSENKFDGSYEYYKPRYCFDSGFENAVRKSANRDGYAPFYESRIQYVLTTGGNWSQGYIGKFKLTIDKGKPDALISFCGQNVKKVGPTTFEVTAENFYPEKDLDILILEPRQEDEGNGG